MAKVNTLFNYFNKTPAKGSPKNAEKQKSTPAKLVKETTESENQDIPWKVGDIVWARLEGYPWWPCLVCNHPTSKTHVRKKKIHVQFFDNPPSRGWIREKFVKTYTGSEHRDFQRGGIYYATDPDVNRAAAEADDAVKKSLDERLELIVCMEPSESEGEEVDSLIKGADLNADIFDAEMDSDEENKKVDENSNPNKQKEEASPSSKKTPTKKTPSKKSPARAVGTRASARKPKSKRRRIVESGDEDMSEDEYKPEGAAASESSDAASSGEAESEIETESEPETPQKGGTKRKRPPPKKSQLVSSSKSVSASPAPVRSSSFTPTVSNKTISKLSGFAASEASSSDQKNEDGQIFEHLTLEFLKCDKIKDAEKRLSTDPDYDPRTLFVPDSFLQSCTPGHRQWWEIKRKHFDTVLFFKMGKFYELFHMDAAVAVNELGMIYMRGNYAHAGFPEIAYGRYADSLIQKGYKVARIEQTETPAMMDERVKKMNRPSKFDKVVRREVCSIQTKGTKRYSFIDGDSSDCTSSYLLAIAEKEGIETGQGSTFGVCFVDTSIGKFHVGQFEDDRHCSRFRTLVSHYPPAHILYERGGITDKTYTIVQKSLVSALKDVLKPGAEFWESSKTLKKLSEKEYFIDEKDEEKKNSYPKALKVLIDEGDSLGHTAALGYDLAVRSLGAIMWYLGRCLMDAELFSMKCFELYQPLDTHNADLNDSAYDSENSQNAKPLFMQGRQKMVLDGMTLANLDILENSTSGTAEGTLLQVLDQCATPFGKRLLTQWVCAPLCNPSAINERLDAIEDLMENPDVTAEVRQVLAKMPDLERQLNKIHTLGSVRRSEDHPDGRAIFFEDVAYSKRKIEDFLSTLSGFKAAQTVLKKFKAVAPNFKSKLLRQAVTVAENSAPGFPDLTEELEFFDNAFDHEKAKKDGTIKPRKGVDEDYDEALDSINKAKGGLDDYLDKQKQRLGCRTITYWGTGKNRYQMEIPEAVSRNAPDEYMVTSQRKGFKRYRTKKIEALLADLIAAEEEKEAAIKDIMRRIFYNFDKSYDKWDLGIQCLALTDVLINLAQFSRCGDGGAMCRPAFVTPKADQQPCIVIRDGRHPCMSRTFSGGDYIPNDTVIGAKDENEMETDEVGSEAKIVLVTGPNMGGKSTLMRQVGLIVVMAQLGCYVPAEECRLTPVDRVFTRLGASDRIMAGESTFFVELSETSAILQHATQHSLVLVDELGRGTATYDGTAIACAVLARLSEVGCRTLFSTHYHSLVDQFSHDANIRTGHMACMVENENEEDPTQETITFLYKFIKGACPKSYGFNAARLADIPDEIIAVAHKKAQDFQNSVDKLRVFRSLCRLKSHSELSQIQGELNRL